MAHFVGALVWWEGWHMWRGCWMGYACLSHFQQMGGLHWLGQVGCQGLPGLCCGCGSFPRNIELGSQLLLEKGKILLNPQSLKKDKSIPQSLEKDKFSSWKRTGLKPKKAGLEKLFWAKTNSCVKPWVFDKSKMLKICTVNSCLRKQRYSQTCLFPLLKPMALRVACFTLCFAPLTTIAFTNLIVWEVCITNQTRNLQYLFVFGHRCRGTELPEQKLTPLEPGGKINQTEIFIVSKY